MKKMNFISTKKLSIQQPLKKIKKELSLELKKTHVIIKTLFDLNKIMMDIMQKMISLQKER